MKYPLIALSLVMLSAGCEEQINVVPAPLKLDYYEESYDVNGLDFVPEYRVQYSYDGSGSLERYTFFAYNPNTDKLEEQRHFRFTYEGGRVQKIEGYNNSSTDPYILYGYSYKPDGNVTKITEQNFDTGITGVASFAYQADTKTVKVTYGYSNGGSFEYEYIYDGGNILQDKTTRGSQLCSNGSYTYDHSINPFASLGYTDFVLLNVSANNKLSEDISYVGCGFPSFVPDSYTYEYNDRGYPTVATTIYKPADQLRKSEKRFYYK
jgi:hypothetical protein